MAFYWKRRKGSLALMPLSWELGWSLIFIFSVFEVIEKMVKNTFDIKKILKKKTCKRQAMPYKVKEKIASRKLVPT